MNSINEDIFNKHYLLFTNSLKLTNEIINNTIDRNFLLEPNYRIVTLQKLNDKPYQKLVNIITNQIAHKSYYINQLFIINCPIARRNIKENLENSFIKDYILDSYNKNPLQLVNILEDILLVDPLTINIKNINELYNYLETLNYPNIKSELNFQINLYSMEVPKFLANFNNNKIFQEKLEYGLYNTESFKLDKTKLNPIVKFNNNVNYVFDSHNIKKLHDNSHLYKLKNFFDIKCW